MAYENDNTSPPIGLPQIKEFVTEDVPEFLGDAAPGIAQALGGFAMGFASGYTGQDYLNPYLANLRKNNSRSKLIQNQKSLLLGDLAQSDWAKQALMDRHPGQTLEAAIELEAGSDPSNFSAFRTSLLHRAGELEDVEVGFGMLETNNPFNVDLSQFERTTTGFAQAKAATASAADSFDRDTVLYARAQQRLESVEESLGDIPYEQLWAQDKDGNNLLQQQIAAAGNMGTKDMKSPTLARAIQSQQVAIFDRLIKRGENKKAADWQVAREGRGEFNYLDANGVYVGPPDLQNRTGHMAWLKSKATLFEELRKTQGLELSEEGYPGLNELIAKAGTDQTLEDMLAKGKLTKADYRNLWALNPDVVKSRRIEHVNQKAVDRENARVEENLKGLPTMLGETGERKPVSWYEAVPGSEGQTRISAEGEKGAINLFKGNAWNLDQIDQRAAHLTNRGFKGDLVTYGQNRAISDYVARLSPEELLSTAQAQKYNKYEPLPQGFMSETAEEEGTFTMLEPYTVGHSDLFGARTAYRLAPKAIDEVIRKHETLINGTPGNRIAQAYGLEGSLVDNPALREQLVVKIKMYGSGGSQDMLTWGGNFRPDPKAPNPATAPTGFFRQSIQQSELDGITKEIFSWSNRQDANFVRGGDTKATVSERGTQMLNSWTGSTNESVRQGLETLIGTTSATVARLQKEGLVGTEQLVSINNQLAQWQKVYVNLGDTDLKREAVARVLAIARTVVDPGTFTEGLEKILGEATKDSPNVAYATLLAQKGLDITGMEAPPAAALELAESVLETKENPFVALIQGHANVQRWIGGEILKKSGGTTDEKNDIAIINASMLEQSIVRGKEMLDENFSLFASQISLKKYLDNNDLDIPDEDIFKKLKSPTDRAVYAAVLWGHRADG